MVGRINNYNYKLFTESVKEIEADGFELMMVAPYYSVLSELICAIEKSGASIPVVHAEKDIGEAFAETDKDILKRAFDTFETNCRVGKHLGSQKIVLHLWSGPVSDSFFENNLTVSILSFSFRESLRYLLLYSILFSNKIIKL
jgi:sugar phosphate isomerase/epimerase